MDSHAFGGACERTLKLPLPDKLAHRFGVVPNWATMTA